MDILLGRSPPNRATVKTLYLWGLGAKILNTLNQNYGDISYIREVVRTTPLIEDLHMASFPIHERNVFQNSTYIP